MAFVSKRPVSEVVDSGRLMVTNVGTGTCIVWGMTITSFFPLLSRVWPGLCSLPRGSLQVTSFSSVVLFVFLHASAFGSWFPVCQHRWVGLKWLMAFQMAITFLNCAAQTPYFFLCRNTYNHHSRYKSQSDEKIKGAYNPGSVCSALSSWACLCYSGKKLSFLGGEFSCAASDELKSKSPFQLFLSLWISLKDPWILVVCLDMQVAIPRGSLKNLRFCVVIELRHAFKWKAFTEPLYYQPDLSFLSSGIYLCNHKYMHAACPQHSEYC